MKSLIRSEPVVRCKSESNDIVILVNGKGWTGYIQWTCQPYLIRCSSKSGGDSDGERKGRREIYIFLAYTFSAASFTFKVDN